jgi:hypothetical protein
MSFDLLRRNKLSQPCYPRYLSKSQASGSVHLLLILANNNRVPYTVGS